MRVQCIIDALVQAAQCMVVEIIAVRDQIHVVDVGAVFPIPLRGGIRVVQRDQLDANTLERLQSAGVTQPIFRQGEATLVALPEIRIEDALHEIMAPVSGCLTIVAAANTVVEPGSLLARLAVAT